MPVLFFSVTNKGPLGLNAYQMYGFITYSFCISLAVDSWMGMSVSVRILHFIAIRVVKFRIPPS